MTIYSQEAATMQPEHSSSSPYFDHMQAPMPWETGGTESESVYTARNNGDVYITKNNNAGYQTRNSLPAHLYMREHHMRRIAASPLTLTLLDTVSGVSSLSIKQTIDGMPATEVSLSNLCVCMCVFVCVCVCVK
jgi:hypothetical protein